MENAGIAPTHLRESSTGVFVGITTSDYGRLAVENDSTRFGRLCHDGRRTERGCRTPFFCLWARWLRYLPIKAGSAWRLFL
jgi:Beta-ketoacyl synthase, N-terminal domain